MSKKIERKKDIDFLLENKEFRKLQLYLYFATVALIVAIYFILIIVFAPYSPAYVSAPITLLFGVYLVYNRNKLVKRISNYLHERKRKEMKRANQEGYQQTMKRIIPRKREIKFNIKGKLPLKDKIKNMAQKLKKKNKDENKTDYIEIK